MNLKEKMSIMGQMVVSRREESIEEVWTEFKEGILSTAAEVCGVRRNKGQRKRTSDSFRAGFAWHRFSDAGCFSRIGLCQLIN